MVVEEEKTYCSDQEALCMEALHFKCAEEVVNFTWEDSTPLFPDL